MLVKKLRVSHSETLSLLKSGAKLKLFTYELAVGITVFFICRGDILKELYNANLQYLKQMDAALYKKIIKLDASDTYIEISKSGEKNIVKNYNGTRYHIYSTINPKEMAECICDNAFSEESDVIFIFGLGLCYELKKMLEKDDKKTYIIIEPDEKIFKVMLENVDISFMINSKADIVFYVGKDLNQVMYVFETIINKLKSLKIKFVISPAYKVIYYKMYEKIVEGLRLKFNRYIVNINSINEHDKVWYKNFVRNLRHIKETVPVKALEGVFKNVPAIICAAGPSISHDMETLKKMKRNVLVASAGTGITVLEANGIKADIAGAMDGDMSEAILFRDLNINRDVNLFYSLQVNQYVLENTEDNKFLMNQTNMDLYINNNLKWDAYGQFSGSSIANVMAENLARLGCNPIIFLGQDLCYSRNKSYAEGAAYHSEISKNEFETSGEYIKVKNKNEEDVYTKPQFISMRDVMETVIAFNKNTEFLNASKDGLKLKGAKDIDFNEYCKTNLYKYKENDFDNVIKHLHKEYNCENINMGIIDDFLNEFNSSLKKIYLISDNIIKTIKSNYNDDAKKKIITDLESKIEEIGFYRDVLKFSVENIEFLTPKSYFDRKLNIYLYVLDKCCIMLNNL